AELRHETETLGRTDRPQASARSAPSGPVRDGAGLSIRHAAVVAGVGLLVMAVLAPFGARIESLAVSGDAVATATNVIADGWMVRAGIVCLFLTAGLDVLVAWALYYVLRRAGEPLARLAA